ncbi:MAG: VRR-NUC domain-containing protein [Maricaulaceae bacterium]
MSKTCCERCVGHVMACSVSITGVPGSPPQQAAIIQTLQDHARLAQEMLARNPHAGDTGSPDVGRNPDGGQAVGAGPGMTAAQIDALVACRVGCCCLAHPRTGASDQDLVQACVSEVFRSADKALNHKSRYKAEISYDMRRFDRGPPAPLMHREVVGGVLTDTTEPSRYWQRRTRDIKGFRPGMGMVRRPDIVIVADPNKPPTQDNIVQVIEQKNKTERRDREQDRAYIRIAGKPEKYTVLRVGGPVGKKETGCDCSNV